MVEMVEIRNKQQARKAGLLEKLQDPQSSISTTYTVLSGLLRIGAPTLSRDILGTSKFTLRDDPDKRGHIIVSGEEFQKLQAIVIEMRKPR